MILSERLQKLCHFDKTISIATTALPEDKIFRELAIPGTIVHEGAIDNIPLRQLMAAREACADFIIAVDGDDILTSPEAVTEIHKAYLNDPQARKKMFYSSGLPLGMNVSCYSVELLAEALKDKQSRKLETGWGRIFEGVQKVEVPVKGPEFPEKLLRFTLDYPEDLDFFRQVASHFQSDIFVASSPEIISYVMSEKIYSITQPVVDKYWDNFYKEKRLEENASE